LPCGAEHAAVVDKALAVVIQPVVALLGPYGLGITGNPIAAVADLDSLVTTDHADLGFPGHALPGRARSIDALVSGKLAV